MNSFFYALQAWKRLPPSSFPHLYPWGKKKFDLSAEFLVAVVSTVMLFQNRPRFIKKNGFVSRYTSGRLNNK